MGNAVDVDMSWRTSGYGSVEMRVVPFYVSGEEGVEFLGLVRGFRDG